MYKKQSETSCKKDESNYRIKFEKKTESSEEQNFSNSSISVTQFNEPLAVRV